MVAKKASAKKSSKNKALDFESAIHELESLVEVREPVPSDQKCGGKDENRGGIRLD